MPVGALVPPALERAAAVAREVLGFQPRTADVHLDPISEIDLARRQYRADRLLSKLRERAADGERVLGLTSVDLFLPVLTYVFGVAELRGVAALVSLHRLDPRFYGESEDMGLTLERLEKEVLHELGHLLGLTHCRDRACAMASAHDPGEIDIEEPDLCPRCRAEMSKGSVRQ